MQINETLMEISEIVNKTIYPLILLRKSVNTNCFLYLLRDFHAKHLVFMYSRGLGLEIIIVSILFVEHE